MQYEEVFNLLWEQLKESIEEESFAKLTMAKTIGKTELKNIYIRPVYSKEGFSVLMKYRYRLKDVEDIEKQQTLEEAFVILKEHLRNPFSSVVLFTTSKDLLFKINKKGVGSITENMPTFTSIRESDRD